ncbi:MAG: uracil-DNA glycosylase [Hyphomicrobiales bacterium]|nr:uracil-DNA glycosylase [Hyphomicrobiales bacterium]
MDLQLGPLEAIESLRWWVRIGVSDALDDAPHNRFADNAAGDTDERGASRALDSVRQSSYAALETGHPAPQDASDARPRDVSETSARALAQSATDLEMLRAIMADFDGCTLKRTATQLVFADGVPGSRVMFVGEAPGEGEDRIGRPFVGRAGQLLDRMLSAIGLDRQKVYIANVVPWRPPGNRTPTLQETQTCLPFIERQIHLADPEYLVCLGASATRTLLGVQGGITRSRGAWFTYSRPGGRDIRALAMLHPAFLLRQPAHKRFAWADMRALANELRGRGV